MRGNATATARSFTEWALHVIVFGRKAFIARLHERSAKAAAVETKSWPEVPSIRRLAWLQDLGSTIVRPAEVDAFVKCCGGLEELRLALHGQRARFEGASHGRALDALRGEWLQDN
jgi:hypothetical protein